MPLNLRAVGAALLASALLGAAGPSSPGVGYVEGVKNPEDLIPLPGTNWIVTGGLGDNMGPGGFFMVDTATHRVLRLYPAASNRVRPDTAAYPDCPGAISPAGFSAHGISLRQGRGRTATLFAMNHVGREAVEVFTLDHSAAQPVLTWIGCVPLPVRSTGNGVAALADGGVVVALMNAPEYFPEGTDLRNDPKSWIAKLAAGETSGYVSTWRRGEGWRKVSGTEGSGPNGVEVSRDGRWLYVARWGNRELMRAPLNGIGTVTKVPVDFSPDNLRWGDDGNLWVAGAAGSRTDYFACAAKPGCHNDYVIAKLDPASLAVTTIPHPETRPTFADVTTAVKLGKRVWIGANPSGRLAYLTLSD